MGALWALVVCWTASRLCGDGFVAARQPRVLGEIVAGVLLGPTGLGNHSATLFPEDTVLPVLKGTANLGLILYMFEVGLKTDVGQLWGDKVQILTLGFCSTLLPAVAAIALSYILIDMTGFCLHAGDVGAFEPFALAMSAAFACSALPVTALILTELGIFETTEGRIATGSAVFVTVLQFLILAFAETASKGSSFAVVFFRLGLVFGLVIVLSAFSKLWTVFNRRQTQQDDGGPSGLVCTMVYCAVVVSALVTDQLGFTIVLGSFLAGCAVPLQPVQLRSKLAQPFSRINAWLLLPIFFVVSGLSTNLRRLTAVMIPGILLVIVVAVCAKLFVAVLSALILRQAWRDAALYNILLNCRGLLVLVINLKAGELGLFGEGAKSALVIMAIVSTAMTGPLVHMLSPHGRKRLTPLPSFGSLLASSTVAVNLELSAEDAPLLLDD